MKNETVLYSAPGAGLGHLVRACAVSLRLAESGVACRIVSNSPFAGAMARMTGCCIDFIESDRLKADMPQYVKELDPRLVVLDTFPWGLRGEWTGRHARDVEFVYVARRMNVGAYLDAMGREWDCDAPQVSRVIVAEPLSVEHIELIGESAEEAVRLPGRIRFPHQKIDATAPPELQKIIDSGKPLWLVVHSGPDIETMRLVRLAERDMVLNDGGELVLIAARPPEKANFPVFDYFPAAKLYSAATCVVTGGGYNSLADVASAGTRHLALAFDRKYDDQSARLNGPPAGAIDGGPGAAQFIQQFVGASEQAVSV